MENLFPKTLAKRLRRRQSVAFVGAGFSMACGMPSWECLLRKILEDAHDLLGDDSDHTALKICEAAIKAKNYTMAADMLRGQMNSGDFDESVREKFSIKIFQQAQQNQKKRMDSRLKNLVKAPWAGVVTTNYDELIEYALGKWVRGDVIKCSGVDPRLGSILCTAQPAQMFFVKIHESISGSNIVLGTEEYDRTYINTPQMISFLTALMLRYHLVFIGCSLDDGNVGPELVDMSPDERVYRALFLTSINLLKENSEEDGTPRYMLTQEAIEAMKSLNV